MAYTDIPSSSSGGAAAPWYNTTAAFAQRLISTLTIPAFSSECWDTANELELGTAVGSATTAPIPTSQGGVIKAATGATANSARILRTKDSTASSVISNLRTSKWACIVKTRIVATPATFILNLCDVTDGATFDTYLGAIQSKSGTNYCVSVGSAAFVDLGVAFDTNWATLAMVADGSNITFYKGSQTGTSMTVMGSAQPQSTAPNAAGYWQFFAQNLATTANAEAHIDSVLVLTEPPTSSM